MLKKFLLCLVFFLFIFPGIFPSAIHFSSIAENDRRTNIVLPANQTINNDYFAAAPTVTILGTINGDAYVVGGNVIVNGTINGDLLTAGGTVTVRGRVLSDVRAAGGQVTITGEVGNSVTVLGGSVNVNEPARINDRLVAATGNLNVFAPIGKGANMSSGQIILGSTIGGGVAATTGQLILTPEANIAGNLDYWSGTDAQIQTGATVAGQTRKHEVAQVSPNLEQARRNITNLISQVVLTLAIVNFISYLVIGLLLLYFFPRHIEETVTIIRQKPWASLGIGLLTLIITPIIVFILSIIIIGIPIALIILALYWIYIYLSPLFVSLIVGDAILRNYQGKAARGWALVLGLVIYQILTLIPFIGWIIILLVTLFGLGGLILSSVGTYNRLRADDKI